MNGQASLNGLPHTPLEVIRSRLDPAGPRRFGQLAKETESSPEIVADKFEHYHILLNFLQETDLRHSYLAYPPQKEGTASFAEGFRQGMIKRFKAAFYESMHEFNDILERIDGLPVHRTDMYGVVMPGKLTKAINYEGGQWTFVFMSGQNGDGLPVEHTTSEILTNFLAATAAESAIMEQCPADDTQPEF